jgi:hypothetical protein
VKYILNNQNVNLESEKKLELENLQAELENSIKS